MSKVILVTGANRGIGFCIAQSLAQRSPDSYTILLASRDISSAENAIANILDTKVTLQPIALDVTSDDSIRACLDNVKERYGRLDVLINNAAIASNPSDSADHTDFCSTYNAILNTNLTSVALLTTLSMPLLSQSPNPRVINISSARASIHNITINNLPPTACVPYSVSKVALNALTLEMGKMYPDVVFYAANPGHCKTALNGFKGKKDPVEGARVVFELVLAKKGRYAPGFWECEGDGMREMKW